MRIKSDVWVRSYIRTCETNAAFAMLVRRGDPDAGAIFIKIRDREGQVWLFGPAVAGLSAGAAEDWGGPAFSPHFDGVAKPESDVDQYLAKMKSFDPDIWIVEVEERSGRHFLEDWLRI